MKKLFKIHAVTIAVTLAIGSFILLSCDKVIHVTDQEQVGSSLKSNVSSPSDHIGETHNQILLLIGTELTDDIATFANLKHKLPLQCNETSEN